MVTQLWTGGAGSEGEVVVADGENMDPSPLATLKMESLLPLAPHATLQTAGPCRRRPCNINSTMHVLQLTATATSTSTTVHAFSSVPQIHTI